MSSFKKGAKMKTLRQERIKLYKKGLNDAYSYKYQGNTYYNKELVEERVKEDINYLANVVRLSTICEGEDFIFCLKSFIERHNSLIKYLKNSQFRVEVKFNNDIFSPELNLALKNGKFEKPLHSIL